MTKRKFNCPAEMTLSLIDGKWKAILLYNLRKGSKRFGELKRLSPGITPTTLTAQLKELESKALIKRIELGPDRTSAVSYELTDRGQSLKPILYSLIRWGIENQEDYALGEFGMARFQK